MILEIYVLFQVLQSDPTLKAEVEYDIRLYERQKKQEKSKHIVIDITELFIMKY